MGGAGPESGRGNERFVGGSPYLHTDASGIIGRHQATVPEPASRTDGSTSRPETGSWIARIMGGMGSSEGLRRSLVGSEIADQPRQEEPVPLVTEDSRTYRWDDAMHIPVPKINPIYSSGQGTPEQRQTKLGMIQKIARGLERVVGPVTLGMMIPRVTQAIKSLQDEGKVGVTAHQIWERIGQQHPPGRLFPMVNGNLPGALSRMGKRGTITPADKDIGVRKIKTYSLAEQPTPEARAANLEELLKQRNQLRINAAFSDATDGEAPEEDLRELDAINARIELTQRPAQ